MARVRPSSNTPAFANSLYYLRGRIILFVEFYDYVRTEVLEQLCSFGGLCVG